MKPEKTMGTYRTKVLLVSPLPPPVGGIATWTKHILKAFEQESEIELLHYDTAIKSRRITQHSLVKRIVFGVKDMTYHIPRIIKFVKQNNIELVHITSSASLGLFRDKILLSRLNKIGKKSVIHFRFGRIAILSKTKNWEWKLLCQVINKATQVIVIDINSYNTLINLGFKNVTYLPNPIAQDIESACRGGEIDFEEREQGRVLFVGHVTQGKGVVELVRAAADIEAIRELILIGPYEDDFRDTLEQIALKRSEGKWLQLKGSQPREVVLENMAKCNIFTLPSHTEGFPNVILESMIMECPTIASSVGAIEDMLGVKGSNICGVCVEPKNIEQLKEALQKLLRDKTKAKEIGVRAKAKVLEEYTTSIVKGKMIILWKSAINKI